MAPPPPPYELPQNFPAALLRGFLGKCPRCGQGSIFKGFISLKERCEVCGLDLTFADAADGPAFFVMLVASVPILGIVLWLVLGVGDGTLIESLVQHSRLRLICVDPDHETITVSEQAGCGQLSARGQAAGIQLTFLGIRKVGGKWKGPDPLHPPQLTGERCREKCLPANVDPGVQRQPVVPFVEVVEQKEGGDLSA